MQVIQPIWLGIWMIINYYGLEIASFWQCILLLLLFEGASATLKRFTSGTFGQPELPYFERPEYERLKYERATRAARLYFGRSKFVS